MDAHKLISAKSPSASFFIARRILAIATLLLGASAATAVADLYSLKLTSSGLGLGASAINDGGDGSVIDPDIAGKLLTSTTAGQGSILTIQSNGLAGPGTLADPLLVTVTANSHLDTLTGLPAGHDYQAGVLYLSSESTMTPDGKDEGLGVRAFRVVGTTGKREIDAGTGRAKIEGSKDVSGGTGPSAYDSSDANGPPHVDENVTFAFNSAFQAAAHSIVAVLSKFEDGDKIDLHIERAVGSPVDALFVGTSNTSIFEELGDGNDNLWKVKLAGVASLLATDFVTSFTIRAVDDNPANPSGTAEHFLISGLTFDASAVPEPPGFQVGVLVCGVLAIGVLGRRLFATR